MEWLLIWQQYYPNRICMNNYTYQDIYSAVVNVATRLQTLSDVDVSLRRITQQWPFISWQPC